MSPDLVLTHFSDVGDHAGAIATIALNNPAKRNALSLAMMRELSAALDRAAATETTRVAVIRGEGTVFSAGHDLTEMQRERTDAFYNELFSTCSTVMQQIHTLRVPVIAQVHGVATAAGCQLVAACDLAVCADDTRFATPGVNIGLFCSTPMVPISRAVGRKRAMEMLLTGTMISAQHALEWGLVNQSVPDSELHDVVTALATTVALASPAVVELGKRAFWQQIDETESAAYARTQSVMSANALLDDAHEGISAFLEKRSPKWPSS